MQATAQAYQTMLRSSKPGVKVLGLLRPLAQVLIPLMVIALWWCAGELADDRAPDKVQDAIRKVQFILVWWSFLYIALWVLLMLATSSETMLAWAAATSAVMSQCSMLLAINNGNGQSDCGTMVATIGGILTFALSGIAALIIFQQQHLETGQASAAIGAAPEYPPDLNDKVTSMYAVTDNSAA